MLVLFLIFAAAIAAVVWCSWEKMGVWMLRIRGALEMANGIRAIALVTALCLLPGVATRVWGEETPDTAASAATATKGDAPAAPAPSPDAPVASSETTETPADKQVAIASAREPVKFVTNIEYLTPNRPDWLDKAPDYNGDDSELYKVSVKAGPYRTVRDCEPDLEREVKTAVSDFVNAHLKAKHAATFVNYSLDELRRRKIVREQFTEQLGTSLGIMNQVHAQLVFDNAFRDDIDARWSEVKSKSRLAQTGLGAGVVLMLLSTLFSYFKLDTATKGYYTGRLQFATAGAILTLVAASVLLAYWIPWM